LSSDVVEGGGPESGFPDEGGEDAAALDGGMLGAVSAEEDPEAVAFGGVAEGEEGFGSRHAGFVEEEESSA